MYAACGGEREGGKGLGITCPPDRIPQTPAGGLRPPAPPAQHLDEYKEWLVYTKLTILIVNLAVKRELGSMGHVASVLLNGV